MKNEQRYPFFKKKVRSKLWTSKFWNLRLLRDYTNTLPVVLGGLVRKACCGNTGIMTATSDPVT